MCQTQKRAASQESRPPNNPGIVPNVARGKSTASGSPRAAALQQGRAGSGRDGFSAAVRATCAPLPAPALRSKGEEREKPEGGWRTGRKVPERALFGSNCGQQQQQQQQQRSLVQWWELGKKAHLCVQAVQGRFGKCWEAGDLAGEG